MSTNTYWHDHQIDLHERARQKNQEPLAIWFTGLSASGKSTIAGALEQVLTAQGYHTYLLDGDNVRFGLCKDLGFGDADRTENIRRIGEVAKLMTDAGLITLTAFISPFREDREIVRELFSDQRFIEVFIDADITTCQTRDPKGLYARALKGEIKKFTGIDSPYEAPQSPEIHIDTNTYSVDASVNQVLAYLHNTGALKNGYQPLKLSNA